MLGLVAEAPAMPQQEEVIGFTVSSGDGGSSATAGGEGAEALLMAMAMDMRRRRADRLQRQARASRAPGIR